MGWTGERGRWPALAAALLVLWLAGCSGGPGADDGPLLMAGFENATGNAAYELWDPWLRDMLIRDLWQAEALVVWPPQRSAELRARAGGGKEALLAAAREAGAGLVAFGRVASEPAGFLLSVEIVRTGKDAASLDVQVRAASPADLPAAVDGLRDAIWKELGVSPPAAPRQVSAITSSDLDAYGEFVAGEVLYHQQRYLAAADRYIRAGRQNLDFAQAHYRHATALMRYVVGEDDATRSAITLAWAKRGGAVERDRLAIEALRALLFGEHAAAADHFAEVRRRFPGDKELDYYHAVTLTRLGREGEALGALEGAVAADPDFSAAWEALAQSAFLAGRREQALTAARRGLEINPADPAFQDLAATFALFAGDLQAAETILADALRFRPDPALLLSRGNLELLRGDVDEALATFESIRSPLSRAMAEVYRGRVTSAVARLDDLNNLQIAAGNRLAASVGLWLTGHLLMGGGEPELALEQFTRGLNLEASFVDTLGAAAVLLARSGETRRAERILTRLQESGPEMDPRNWERQALWVEGELARATGEHARAIDLLKRARQQGRVRFLAGGYVSDAPLFADALARAYLDQGDVAAAERVSRELVELHADRLYWPWLWMEAQVRLAELAVRGNRPEEAQRHAGVVRRYWPGAGGQGQPLVDGLLERLDRVVPER